MLLLCVCVCARVSIDTLLGPYLGKTVRKELVDSNYNNQWLWEVSIYLYVCVCACVCVCVCVCVNCTER